jgi:hypothetical protein
VQRRVNGAVIHHQQRPGLRSFSGLEDLVADTDAFVGEEKSWLI